ncbi:MAG: hypothetical protein QOK31_593 [Solirubrobacteraceae bacterium]|jgi:hypothetical protein|nr:hypothetical protein [Solirubrobacteraceae bacterium]
MTAVSAWRREVPVPRGRTDKAKGLHQRVALAFPALRRAWSNRDAEPVRHFLSEASRTQLADAFDALDREFLAIRIEDVELVEAVVRRPRGSNVASHPESVYVSYRAAVWVENLRTGAPVEHPSAPRGFVQHWRLGFDYREGWLVESIATLWEGAADALSPDNWPELPEGWYSRAARPAKFREWDGSAWTSKRERSN